MADVRIHHQIHWVEIDRLASTMGGAYRDVLRRAVRVQNGARRRVRVDTGRTRSSIHITEGIESGGMTGVRVGSDVEYAPYVGTNDCIDCWGEYLDLDDARG